MASDEPRDLTASTHGPGEGDPTDDPVYQKTRRQVIRVGNVIFAALALWIFIPMLIGVGQGISDEKVWDPYTGQPVYERAEGGCLEEGRQLLIKAGRLERLEHDWAEPSREWQLRCRETHPELSEAINTTRDMLRKKIDPREASR